MEPTSQKPAWILPVIVLSQFAGTSLWFAGNAVIPDLIAEIGIPENSTSTITSAVQFGFISGTLLFAVLNVADRISPRLVFFSCALLAAMSNFSVTLATPTYTNLLLSRFIIGFFLAGIYPVGMKIAAGWYKDGLGKALGYLVGALVLGTAFPHLIKSLGKTLEWREIMIWISIVAAGGGLLLYLLVPDGPYISKGSKFNPRVIINLFKIPRFKAAALGYFGHMWELYTFWAFVPFLIAMNQTNQPTQYDLSILSFIVIGSGFFSCIIGGYIALSKGSALVAGLSLLISGLCIAVAPWMLNAPSYLFFPYLIVWGLTVISDSPQFSSLVAKNADPNYVGSGLTIVNCIGFAITIFSLSLFDYTSQILIEFTPLVLLPGPILGLISMRPLFRSN